MAGFSGEGGLQPLVYDGQGQILTGDTGTDGHAVGVVVEPGQLGGHQVPQQGAANALDLIGGDGHADTRGAQQHTPVAASLGYRLGGGTGKIRVVAAILAVAAEVHHLVSLFGQVGHYGLLQVISAVVTGNSDFHVGSSLVSNHVSTVNIQHVSGDEFGIGQICHGLGHVCRGAVAAHRGILGHFLQDLRLHLGAHIR